MRIIFFALAFLFFGTTLQAGEFKNFKASGCNLKYCFILEAPAAYSGHVFANLVSFKSAKLTLVNPKNRKAPIKTYESSDAYYDFKLGSIVLRSVSPDKNRDYIFGTQSGEIQEFFKITKL